MPRNTGSVADRIPAPVLFLTAGFSQFFGAAVGIGLFSLAAPHTVAWMRSVVACVIIVVIVRPWRVDWTRRTLLESAGFGVILLAMNMTVYVAFNYLPLGVAVTLEFIGPILLSAARSRSGAGKVAAVLAFAGVGLISILGLDWEGLDPGGLAIGLIAIFTASALWVAYIVLGSRIAGQRSGQASLAVGMIAAVVVFTPLAAPWAAGLFVPAAVVPIIAMGVLTSVIPYMLDQVAIRRLSVSSFAILNALLPATATLVGYIALRQLPGPAEILGLLAIAAAMVLAHRGEAAAV